MTGPNPWARDIAAQASQRSASEKPLAATWSRRDPGAVCCRDDTDQARQQTPHARLISAAATLARYQGLAGDDADKVSEATLTRQTSLALTVKNSADALVRDHAAATRERAALHRTLLVMNAVVSSPVCHPHNVVMLRDGIDAARAALGDTP